MSDELRDALHSLLYEYGLGDFVYEIREQCWDHGTHQGDSWSHPYTVRFKEIVAILEREVPETSSGPGPLGESSWAPFREVKKCR